MNPKLTVKKFQDYLKQTKRKFQFKARTNTANPIAWYLRDLGNTNVVVTKDMIAYINRIGEGAEYTAPRWVSNFLDTYTKAPAKHRLSYAARTLNTQTAKTKSI